MIPIDQCVAGAVYKLHSRNLNIGVFNPLTKGFIGIRTKFGSRYLFTEYHSDTGAPFGTVYPQEVIGHLPAEIKVSEDLGTEDDVSKRPMHFAKMWIFSDTGETVEDVKTIRPCSVFNNALFDELLKYEK